MSDIFSFLENNKLYVALLVSILIWISIFLFLIKIEKRINENFENKEDGKDEK